MLQLLASLYSYVSIYAYATTAIQAGQPVKIMDMGDGVMKIQLLDDGRLEIQSQSLPANMSYDQAQDLNVTIYKPMWKRGFFVNQPYFDESNNSISLNFYRYNGSRVEYYDEGHRHDKVTGFASNYVRGVKKVVLTFDLTKRPSHIYFYAEPWIFDSVIGPFWSFLLLTYFLYLYYLMFKAKWVKAPCSRYSDSDDNSKKQSGKWKLNAKYTFKMVVHNLDLYTDLNYLFTVQMFSTWIRILMILSIALPIMAIMFFSFEDDQEDYTGYSGIRGKIIFFFLLFTSSLSLYEINVMDELDEDYLEGGQQGTGMVFLLEDGPQFLLQMLNSIMVGSNWKWVQIASPFLSLVSLTKRVVVESKDEEVARVQKGAFVGQLVCCVLPIVVIMLCVSSYGDSRPEWAQLHSSIRMGDEKQPPIY